MAAAYVVTAIVTKGSDVYWLVHVAKKTIRNRKEMAGVKKKA